MLLNSIRTALGPQYDVVRLGLASPDACPSHPTLSHPVFPLITPAHPTDAPCHHTAAGVGVEPRVLDIAAAARRRYALDCSLGVAEVSAA